jgi:DNA-binding SARP family transcriptional activator
MRQEQELTLGHPRQRALLAMLAVHADRPVRRDELIDGIWGSTPPVTAANCMHSYVARLRLVLEPGRPAHTPSRILVYPQAAREAWQHALAILEGLHHPDVTPLRAGLARVS